MHVISRRRLREFWAAHPDAEGPLAAWFKVAGRAAWGKFADVRADYPHADLVERYIVFNIGGNKYRLIAEVYFEDQVVLVRHVLTHKDYDEGRWKARPAKPDAPPAKRKKKGRGKEQP